MHDRKQVLGFLLLFLYLPVHLVFPHRAPPTVRHRQWRRCPEQTSAGELGQRFLCRFSGHDAGASGRRSQCPGMATHGIAGCARFPRDLAPGQALQPGVAHPLPESRSSRGLHRRPDHHQGVSEIPLSGYSQYPREYPLVPEWILVDTGGIPAERPVGPFFVTLEQLFTRKCVFSPPLLRQVGRKCNIGTTFFANGCTRVQHWNNFFANLRTEVLKMLHFCGATRGLPVSSLKNIS